MKTHDVIRNQTKPRLMAALRLRCPYCSVAPLQAKGKWFEFGRGCETCDYRYEREVGYYVGSTWMVNYTVISCFGIVVAAALAFGLQLSGLMIATWTSLSLILFGLFFFPFGNAIWLYADHVFHPLTEKDRMSTQPDIRQ